MHLKFTRVHTIIRIFNIIKVWVFGAVREPVTASAAMQAATAVGVETVATTEVVGTRLVYREVNWTASESV